MTEGSRPTRNSRSKAMSVWERDDVRDGVRAARVSENQCVSLGRPAIRPDNVPDINRAVFPSSVDFGTVY